MEDGNYRVLLAQAIELKRGLVEKITRLGGDLCGEIWTISYGAVPITV